MVNLAQTDPAGNRCGQFGVIQLQFGVVDQRLVHLDAAAVLFDYRLLRHSLLSRDGILFQQGLVTALVEFGVFQ